LGQALALQSLWRADGAGTQPSETALCGTAALKK
jgi:hypothetical protein